MPQRRDPFSYGQGQGQMHNPMSMPMTGTGTDTDPAAYTQDAEQLGPVMGEAPATTRRRLMPVAGPISREPDMLTAVQQMLAQRKGP